MFNSQYLSGINLGLVICGNLVLRQGALVVIMELNLLIYIIFKEKQNACFGGSAPKRVNKN